MKNGLYCLYNSLSKRFTETFESESDTMATYLYSKANIPDKKYKEVCKIGEIDLETGTVTALQAPIHLEAFPLDEATEINAIEKDMLKKE